jgi:hypothetical protein
MSRGSLSTKLDLHFPYGKPIKREKKDRLVADLISSFQSVGDSSAKVEDSYYIDKHAMAEVVTWVVVVLTTLGSIATIAMAIREFLKKNPDITELRVKTKSIDITIKGSMSNKEIQRIVTEGRKIVESEKSK